MNRTGIGWDSHRLVAGRPLVLGGVTIESDLGLEGHSDADVLTHAVIDALLGAEGVVLEPVSGMDGRIKLGGEVWSARAYDGFSEFEVGQRVQVLQIEGATALVAA